MKRYVGVLVLMGLLFPGANAAAASQGDPPPKEKKAQPAVKLKAEELEALWTTLAGKDAAKAYKAIFALAAAPEQSVPFLAQRLRKDTAPEARRIAQLVADLDS